MRNHVRSMNYYGDKPSDFSLLTPQTLKPTRIREDLTERRLTESRQILTNELRMNQR